MNMVGRVEGQRVTRRGKKRDKITRYLIRLSKLSHNTLENSIFVQLFSCLSLSKRHWQVRKLIWNVLRFVSIISTNIEQGHTVFSRCVENDATCDPFLHSIQLVRRTVLTKGHGRQSYKNTTQQLIFIYLDI